jgi:hypothetical protein
LLLYAGKYILFAGTSLLCAGGCKDIPYFYREVSPFCRQILNIILAKRMGFACKREGYNCKVEGFTLQTGGEFTCKRGGIWGALTSNMRYLPAKRGIYLQRRGNYLKNE